MIRRPGASARPHGEWAPVFRKRQRDEAGNGISGHAEKASQGGRGQIGKLISRVRLIPLLQVQSGHFYNIYP